MNFKIDIYQLKELADHGSEIFYFGSLTGKTNKDVQHLINLFHFEGLRIISYNLNDLIIIELTGFLIDGDHLKNIARSSEELQIINKDIKEIIIQKEDNSDFVIIENNQTYETFSEYNLEFLKENETVLIESQNIVEWGASGFFETYIVNVISNLTSTLIENLLSKGISKDSISRFNLPNNIKRKIAKEYNIKPNSLFLESFRKENSSEFITYRNTYFKVNLVIENSELVSLNVEHLNKYI